MRMKKAMPVGGTLEFTDAEKAELVAADPQVDALFLAVGRAEVQKAQLIQQVLAEQQKVLVARLNALAKKHGIDTTSEAPGAPKYNFDPNTLALTRTS